MEKLAEHQLGLAMRKEYDIDENFFMNFGEQDVENGGFGMGEKEEGVP